MNSWFLSTNIFNLQGQTPIRIRFLSEKIKMMEARSMDLVEKMPAYEQLLTIPGVGKVLGTTIILETGDINRFDKPGNYTSYCRCVKARHTSNGKVKGKNNGKNGNKYLSWAFVEAAHHCIRYCKPANRFYQRKKERANGALATKALASKLSKAAYYIMKNGTPFDVRMIFG
jgi:transposase